MTTEINALLYLTMPLVTSRSITQVSLNIFCKEGEYVIRAYAVAGGCLSTEPQFGVPSQLAVPAEPSSGFDLDDIN